MSVSTATKALPARGRCARRPTSPLRFAWAPGAWNPSWAKEQSPAFIGRDMPTPATNTVGNMPSKFYGSAGRRNAPAIARLRREAMVGRCVANRHVISILTAHVHQPPYYVVMPWLEGAGGGGSADAA